MDFANIKRRLAKEALSACTFRGHKMGRFDHYCERSAVAKCKLCRMEVHINAKPLPNEIDISGEAVALNCKGDLLKTP